MCANVRVINYSEPSAWCRSTHINALVRSLALTDANYCYTPKQKTNPREFPEKSQPPHPKIPKSVSSRQFGANMSHEFPQLLVFVCVWLHVRPIHVLLMRKLSRAYRHTQPYTRHIMQRPPCGHLMPSHFNMAHTRVPTHWYAHMICFVCKYARRDLAHKHTRLYGHDAGLFAHTC